MRERLARAWPIVLGAALVAAALLGLALIRDAPSSGGAASDGAKSERRDSSDRAKRDWSDPSERSRNERILAGLKAPAGARAQSKVSKPSYESVDDVHSRRTGYMTDLEYDVPRGVSQRDVVRNYDRQLRSWRRHEEGVPCEDYASGDVPENCKPIVIVEYALGRARVSLNIDGYGGARPWGYELTVVQVEAR